MYFDVVSEEEIEAALTGHYRPEHLLALHHHLACV